MAAAASAIAAATAVVLLVGGGDGASVASPPTTPPVTRDRIDDGCIVLDGGELRLATSGIVGTPLGAALRAGLKTGYRVESLFAAQIPADQFGQPWFAVSGRIFDGAGDPVGVATWLSPQLRAVFRGESPAPAEWAVAPDAHPEETHLYAADALAARVSIWRPLRVDPASQRAASVCVEP